MNSSHSRDVEEISEYLVSRRQQQIFVDLFALPTGMIWGCAHTSVTEPPVLETGLNPRPRER